MTKKYYRPDEIAEMLHVSKRTVFNWVAKGQVEFVKIGGTLRIALPDPEDLKALGSKKV